MTITSLSWALERAANLQGHAVELQQLADLLPAAVETADERSAMDLAVSVWSRLINRASGHCLPLGRLEAEDFPVLALHEGDFCVLRPGSDGATLVERMGFPPEHVNWPPSLLTAALRAPGPVLERAEKARTAQRNSVSWFWREIAKFTGSFVEIGLGSFAANTLALAGSVFAMQVYDRVVPNAAYQTLWVLAAGLAVAILFETMIRAARAQLLDSACKQIDIRLSDGIFRHLLAIKMNARPQSLGTLAAQVRDFEVVRGFLTSTSLFALADLPFVFLFLLVIWAIGGPVVWVPAVVFVVTVSLAALGQLPLRRLSELHVAEANQRNGLLVEAIDGAETIKATGSEWQLSKHWAQLTEQLSVDSLHIRSISNITMGVANALQQIGYAGMIIVGVYLIGEGELTMGALIACSMLSGRIFGPITQIVGLAFQWNHARIALRALDKLMQLPSDNDPGARPVIKESISARMRLERASFSYTGSATAAFSADRLEFSPGEKVAIVGPTGSGKSTLIKLLSGLYEPTAGRVFLDGIDAKQMDRKQLRASIGYLPQETRLFQGTLRDNLTRGLGPLSDEDILAVCRSTGLDRLIDANPKGFGLEISEGGRGLSGGQKQLVGLTRTLLGQPRVLLLDEPTAAMDQQLEMRTLRALISQTGSDRLLICVTHRPLVMGAVDRIIVCDKGKIAMDGPRAEVLKRFAPPMAVQGGSA